MLGCKKWHANQLSCATRLCMSAAGISFVCLYGSHCIVTLDVLTRRGALVFTSVCRHCRSLHAAQASLSQSIAALTGTFSLLLVTTSSCASRNVCQQFSTCHQSFAKKELQNYLHTCCKEACINAYRLCSCGMACKDCCH